MERVIQTVHSGVMMILITNLKTEQPQIIASTQIVSTQILEQLGFFGYCAMYYTYGSIWAIPTYRVY